MPDATGSVYRSKISHLGGIGKGCREVWELRLKFMSLLMTALLAGKLTYRFQSDLRQSPT